MASLIVMGTFLRGPNWNFFGFYEKWDTHKVEALNNIDLSQYFWINGMGQALPKAPPGSGALRELGYIVYREWLGIALLITLISEFASNVACIQLMLPVLAPLAVSLHADPLLLMVPATLSASFGYMMPVATAPNTIVYGTGHIPAKEMMRTGFRLNLIAILLLTLYTFLFY